MFDVLPASGAHPDIGRKWLATSVITHALILALVIVGTREALQARRASPADTSVLLFVPPSLEPAARHEPDPMSDMVAAAPREFQDIPLPTDVPAAIPPIDLGQRPFDPRSFAEIRDEREVGDSPVSTETTGAGGIYQATTAVEGFDPAVLLAQPEPKYPAALLAAGLAGVVTVEFVIDTTGKVEAGSIRTIESTHPAFEQAARAAVLGARFRPAQLRGQAVRQITRQRVRFVSDPSGAPRH